MKVQITPKLQLSSNEQNTPKKDTSNVAFTGGETFIQFLRFLETNQAWGATAVDAGCMGIPRSAVDFSRGPDAGLETMRREFSSTGNHALIGAYGLGAALLLAQPLNKQFGIKANSMFISDDTIDVLGHAWNETKDMNKFLHDVIANTKGFNPDLKGSDANGWIGVEEKTQREFVERLAQEIKNGPEKMDKGAKAYLKSLIADATGAESKFKIEKEIINAKNGKETIKSISTLDDFIDNVYKISKAFAKGDVAKTFSSDKKLLSDNTFIKGLKGLNSKVAIAGIAIATLVGVSVQPFNAYLTKKKTGKSGFVGVEGREPDKSNGFKLLKLAAAGAFGLCALRTIGPYSKILSKIQFKGFTPTMEQFKFIYSMTIMSRFLSARDKNELREASTKDSLGFANWLILGGFVSKLTAAAFEKMNKFKNDKFIRYNEAENGKSWFSWLTKSSIVTRDEVLHSALKKAGVSTIKSNGTAMTFKEMLKAAAEHAPGARTKIRYLGFIQLAGYLYSGIVLGVGIPKLNIAITRTLEKKKKSAEKALSANQSAPQSTQILASKEKPIIDETK